MRKLLVSLLLFFVAEAVMAVPMPNRLGVGFRNAYSIDLPSIATIYYPNETWGFVGALGVDTKDQNSSFAVTAGLRKLIFPEDNMNFFMGGLLSMVSQESSGQTDSGFELGMTIGVEFFLQGLPNLGFNMETGIGVTNVKKVRFRTLGDHFLRAGIMFYF